MDIKIYVAGLLKRGREQRAHKLSIARIWKRIMEGKKECFNFQKRLNLENLIVEI